MRWGGAMPVSSSLVGVSGGVCWLLLAVFLLINTMLQYHAVVAAARHREGRYSQCHMAAMGGLYVHVA